MPTLQIHRLNEYNNRARDYHLYLDGIKLGAIANGSKQEITIAPGEHTLYAKIDWCSSPEINFTIKENEYKKFSVGGFKYANWLMPAGAAIMALHFILKYVWGFQYLVFLVAPFFLLLLYFLTAGRKKYLTLSEN